MPKFQKHEIDCFQNFLKDHEQKEIEFNSIRLEKKLIESSSDIIELVVKKKQSEGFVSNFAYYLFAIIKNGELFWADDPYLIKDFFPDQPAIEKQWDLNSKFTKDVLRNVIPDISDHDLWKEFDSDYGQNVVYPLCLNGWFVLNQDIVIDRQEIIDKMPNPPGIPLTIEDNISAAIDYDGMIAYQKKTILDIITKSINTKNPFLKKHVYGCLWNYYDLEKSLRNIYPVYTSKQLRDAYKEIEQLKQEIPIKAQLIQVVYFDRLGKEHTETVSYKKLFMYSWTIINVSLGLPVTGLSDEESWINLYDGTNFVPLHHVKSIVYKDTIYYENKSI